MEREFCPLSDLHLSSVKVLTICILPLFRDFIFKTKQGIEQSRLAWNSLCREARFELLILLSPQCWLSPTPNFPWPTFQVVLSIPLATDCLSIFLHCLSALHKLESLPCVLTPSGKGALVLACAERGPFSAHAPSAKSLLID